MLFWKIVSINYNSLAQQDDGSCYTCNSTYGYVEDSNGSLQLDPFILNNFDNTVVASTSSTSDGELAFSAAIAAFVASNNALTSTMSYTLTLKKLNIHGDWSSAASTISTTTGITLANGPNINYTGLAHGYYGVQVEIEDSSTGSDAGLEICWMRFYQRVKVKVCIGSW